VRRRGGAPVTEARLSQRTVKMGGRDVTIARPEGVAHSIERHAAATVGSTLSEKALERRQPLVRAQAANAAGDHGVSRSGRTAPESRSSTTERQAPLSSQHRIDRSGFSTRTGFDRRTATGSTQTTSPVSTSRFSSPREREMDKGSGPTYSPPGARPSASSRSLVAPFGSYRSSPPRTEKAVSGGTSSSLRHRVERTQSSRSAQKAVPRVQPGSSPRRPSTRADQPDSSRAKQSTSTHSSSRRTRRQ
jgi:hypothetical protein